jgi:hypothetical protein
VTDFRTASFVLVLAVAAAGGCSREPAASASAAAQPASVPQAAAQPAPGAVQKVSGTVAETMDASTYTYLRVKTGSGEIWAAAGRFKVAVGDRVVVPLETPMKDFHSQSLDRDFPLIYFVSRVEREGDPAPGGGETPPVPMALGHAASGSGPHTAAEPTVVERVAPVAGGTSVSDVWERRAALAGRTVTVRGKVVKFNAGILGRNWIHLQDGTGTSGQGFFDLTITTASMVKVGDVVTATGRVALDRDFGAGYAYKVMIEDATVVAK